VYPSMKRFLAIVALCALLSPVVLARRRSVGPVLPVAVPIGEPFAGITASERARFDAGKVEFEQVETVASGLGPVFNSRACGECHHFGAIGGGSERMVTR